MDPVNGDTSLVPGPSGLPVHLANGTRVVFRPIAAEDKVKLQFGMGHLSAAARRQRFFSALGELDDELVAYLTEIDYRSHFAWVAVDADRPGDPIVAVGRYIEVDNEAIEGPCTPDVDPGMAAPRTAEIAFVVGDDYRRLGIASMLLDLLTIVAQANGIDRFYARVLGENLPMRHILTRAGAKLKQDDAGVLCATMPLPAPSKRFSPVVVRSIGRAAAVAAYRRSA